MFCKHFFDKIIKLAYLRCTLVEVEAVSGIKHNRAFFALFSQCHSCNSCRHGSVTMNDIVVIFLYQLFKFFIGCKVSCSKGRSVKVHPMIFITVRDIYLVTFLKIVTCTYVNGIALLLKPFQIGNMELQNVFFGNRSNK